MLLSTGFAWPSFGRKGVQGRAATGVASVGSCQKLPPFPTEPIPGSSKAGQGWPIRNGGNSFAITYVKRKKEKVIVQL